LKKIGRGRRPVVAVSKRAADLEIIEASVRVGGGDGEGGVGCIGCSPEGKGAGLKIGVVYLVDKGGRALGGGCGFGLSLSLGLGESFR